MILALVAWTVSHAQPMGWQYASEAFSVADQRSAVLTFTTASGRFSLHYNSVWSRHIGFYQTVLKNQKAPTYDRNGWTAINELFLPRGYEPSFTLTAKNEGSDAKGVIKHDWEMTLPYWSIAMAVLIPGIAALFIHLRQKRLTIIRRMNGLCLACGYDLRSSIDRCPECGVAIMETAP